MDINEVVTTIEKENPQAAQVLTDYVAASNNALEKIGTLEKDLKQSAEKRDRLKTIIRTATGLEEITSDNLTEFLTKGDTQVDTYKNEITQLQTKLSESANAVDEVAKQYEAKIFDLNLDRVLTMMGASNEVHNSHAYGVILDAVKQNAMMEGDDIVYKNADGTTVYADSGVPATVQTVYESLRSDDNYSYLFKEQYLAGGGKGPQGPKTTNGGEALRRSKMSDEDKAAYIAKHTMAAYRALPL